jgi:four helix bundle protein
MSEKRTEYDIEDTLVGFTVLVMDTVDGLSKTRAGRHVGEQMIRCGTSPAANYGEAQSAESRKDFIHKMKVALKELRETRVWLKIVRIRSMAQSDLSLILQECEELLCIFTTSVRTAERNAGRTSGRRGNRRISNSE